MTAAPAFEGRRRLPCGHTTAFAPWPEEGDGRTLVHQKGDEILLAYARLFEGRNRPRRALEIGVARGGSLALWADILGAEVVGIDSDLGRLSGAFRDHLGEGPPISVHELRMPDQAALGLGRFDLIVDDAEHDHALIIGNFRMLWPSVRPGGLYVIEDWISDQSAPEALAGQLARALIGDHWPSAAPAGAPRTVSMCRALIAIEAPP